MADALKVQIANHDGEIVEANAVVDKNGEWVIEFEGGFLKFPECTEAELANLITTHNNANAKPIE